MAQGHVTHVWGEPLSGDPFTDRRRTGIGGSDAGAILGISPWGSALGVWQAKRGIEAPTIASERMVWGKRLERAVLDGYMEDTDRKVRRGRFARHAEHPFVIGHPDGIADDRVVEVKVIGYLDDRWGEPGSEDIPPYYYSQVQHYMLLTGLPLADLAALVGGRGLSIFTIPANPEFQAAMLADEADLWKRVETGEPPDPDGSEDAGRALRRMFPQAIPDDIVATPEVARYAEAYLGFKQRAKEADHEADRMAQLIQRYMGSRERMVSPEYTASWPNIAGSTRWKEVAASYRDLLVPYHSDAALDAIAASHRGEPSRRFTIHVKR